jgi:hypothetical protein
MKGSMTGTPQLGRVLAVAGAAVLAVSVFLPWYSVAITPGGAAYAQVALNSAAQRYGNATLQAEANTIGTSISSVAGHQVATVTAHQLLKTVSVVLLILAALAFLGALMWLAEIEEPIEVDGGQVAAVGALALLLVLFRMVDRPSVAFFSLSLSWGVWLALLSSVAVVAGGLLGRAPKQRGVETPFAPVGYSRPRA